MGAVVIGEMSWATSWKCLTYIESTYMYWPEITQRKKTKTSRRILRCNYTTWNLLQNNPVGVEERKRVSSR